MVYLNASRGKICITLPNCLLKESGAMLLKVVHTYIFFKS